MPMSSREGNTYPWGGSDTGSQVVCKKNFFKLSSKDKWEFSLKSLYSLPVLHRRSASVWIKIMCIFSPNLRTLMFQGDVHNLSCDLPHPLGCRRVPFSFAEAGKQINTYYCFLFAFPSSHCFNYVLVVSREIITSISRKTWLQADTLLW